MVVDDREAWKAREEDYRSRRRKRRHKRVTGSTVGRLWDEADPPIAWDSLVPRWQDAIMSFARQLENGPDIEGAWNMVAPSHHCQWGGPTLGEPWERAIREVGNALRELGRG